MDVDKLKSMGDTELFLEYKKSKDERFRNEIIDRYINIAKMVARRYSGRGIEFDDLYQVASLGLLYAAERFDADKGVKFATFAMPTITGEVKRYFRDKGNFIKVPRKIYEIFNKAQKIRCANCKGCKYCNKIKVLSLDAQLSEDNPNNSLDNFLGAEDDSYLLVENKDFIDSCIKELNDQEQEFIKMRYYNEQTQKQIAEKMGVSQMFVSRLERKVLGRLKDMYFKAM